MNGGGDPGRIRTCNPQSRNLMLYPVELRDRLGLSLVFWKGIARFQTLFPRAGSDRRHAT